MCAMISSLGIALLDVLLMIQYSLVVVEKIASLYVYPVILPTLPLLSVAVTLQSGYPEPAGLLPAWPSALYSAHLRVGMR